MTEGSDTDTGLRLEHAPPGSSSWERLQHENDPKAFAGAWLDFHCRAIARDVHQGVVVFGPPDQGPFAPIAMWPEGTLGSPSLAAAIEQAMVKRRAVIDATRRPAGEGRARTDVIAAPLVVEGHLCGSVALALEHAPEDRQAQALEQLQFSAMALETLVHRTRYTAPDRVITVLGLVASSLQEERFQGAATAVATELATILTCERVSIGFLRGRHCQVKALSHSAAFGKKANLIRAMEAAMDEAVDQHATVLYPAPEGGPVQVLRAHAALAGQPGSGTICTVPFTEGQRILGAMTLERGAGQGFDATSVRLCQHAASLLGPLLEVKRKEDRWLILKAGDSLRDFARRLVGPRHTALKLMSGAALALLLFFSFANGEYRVTADARLKGTVQRAIAVPMDGYIAEALVRAGDIVKAQDLLFTLDDSDLRLERLKWLSQQSQYTREYNEARAEHDRAKFQILAAQIDQANAQVALVEEQLSRIQVRAPFDSFVVTGDLSQSLGAPVQRGDILFEIAPLGSYRVILSVDERDIVEVAVGDSGSLVLNGMPGERIAIRVDKITPISTAKDGRNLFQVEAVLATDEALTKLRPGMEGVAKIAIGQRKLIWIWTHKITHWFRMFLWSWWP